jgi:hypothetical protein
VHSIVAAHVGVEEAPDGRIFEGASYVAWYGDIDIAFVVAGASRWRGRSTVFRSSRWSSSSAL